MPRRHQRTASEIAQYAAELSERWTRGDGIEPWLREVEPELTRKVQQERWTWESIALALNEAGIRYETDRPWTGKLLTMKVAIARRKRTIRAAAKPQPLEAHPVPARPSPPLAAGPASQQVPAPARQEPEDKAPGPVFEPVRFKKPPPPRKAAVPPPPRPAEPKLDADTAIARMFGRAVPAKGGS